MRSNKEYDGNEIVVHKVKQGETLSSIAKRYRFGSWMPIWVYNTRIHQVLHGTPDELRAGQPLFIPRSQQGYDRLITKFKVLKMRMQYFGDQELYTLEAAFYRHQADRVLIDTLADMLTTVATVGLKARHASEVYAAAQKVVGRERIAAEYLARKASEDVAKELKKKSIEQFMDLAKEKSLVRVPEHQKEKAESAYTAIFKTSPKAIQAVRSFSLQGGKALLDVSEMILDYVKPSTIADAWLAYVAGVGKPEDVYRKSRDQVIAAVGNSCDLLQNKILRVEKEKELLYSSP